MGLKSGISILMGIGKRMPVFAKTTLMALSLTIVSCGGNLWEAMSNKTSDAALVEDIRYLVNKQRFTEAIELIEDNPELVPANRTEKMLFASAYAGGCGLTFAEVFESLETASGSPMKFMMSAFTNKIIDPAKCHTAQQYLESIGAVGVRSVTENIALFLVGFGKVGTYLRNRADTSVAGIGDGTVDATFDSCDNTDLPRADIKQVITGFGLMIENISALGSNVSPTLSTDIANLTLACTGLGMDCTETDPTAIPDADADEFRDAIKSHDTNQIGIETCDPLTPMCC